MIKIGIDPSGSGTTAIVIYQDNILLDKKEIINKDWKKHYEFIYDLVDKYYYADDENHYLILESCTAIVNIENCLYTNANGSKDRDDLLRLLGVAEWYFTEWEIYINWVSPRHTKSVLKNMENLSKYNDSCLWEFDKDTNLTYEYGKGWKYNNEKISNHLRDAIIIANYER
ncbi:hypothetical protein SRED_002371 [Spiroplasma melliferum]|uniref:Uncharacterized protein n=1 Tax=Spiroplasma melliferum TaxID=2134 RepID=A0ABX5U9Z7_SPIME|nr:hypothetical protein [Spiroplasma melliferum]QCO23891.1 hypothetical protein SRED_002371 [Spiroplasma melliferum]